MATHLSCQFMKVKNKSQIVTHVVLMREILTLKLKMRFQYYQLCRYETLNQVFFLWYFTRCKFFFTPILAVVCMVLVLPLIFSSSLFNEPLRTVSSVPTIIGITVTSSELWQNLRIFSFFFFNFHFVARWNGKIHFMISSFFLSINIWFSNRNGVIDL